MDDQKPAQYGLVTVQNMKAFSGGVINPRPRSVRLSRFRIVSYYTHGCRIWDCGPRTTTLRLRTR